MNTNNAISLADVVSRPVERLGTGIPFLDWCFGSTADQGRRTWGLPAGGLTLLHGAGGCGKSRVAIMIAAAMTRTGQRIIYAQSEVALHQFKGWVSGQQANQNNFLVTSCDESETLIGMIMELRPALVVIDSISMLAGIERQRKAKEIILSLKRTVEAVGAHGLLLAHENAQGKVKGGTLLPHLVDVVARMYRTGYAEWTRFEVGKNRFGPSGRSATFNHEAHGLVPAFVSDADYPMFQVRFDPMTGAERRLVPIPNSGGRLAEVDGDGRPLVAPKPKGFLQRIANLL